MTEIKPFYDSEITCPVCDKTIKVTKVRSKFVRLLKHDEDFCPHYETINPVLYEAWVCSFCGYAAHNSVYEHITTAGRKAVLEKITPNWTSREFTGERNYEKALEAFKLVLYNLQVREAPYSEFAKICLRIAWIYRYMGNQGEEERFLKYAYDYYKKVYTRENLKDSSMDEYTCMYMIGVLAKKLNLISEAKLWFSRLISFSIDPREKDKIKPFILENAREQIQLLKNVINDEEEKSE
ncbi:hypothetical protein Cst_c13370 [Thermoclostridium stercorarium subsp. stercorarium DSM 8532]|jgi:uncharacterized protein (DUF2225 family)|uniref:DUF2225 domain-containing protein n=2 Tax=Thermoclostridium stercorarium TaxID=1510 RepID=L7VRY1_THES1|nr:DUF2225 domain-containing protein [Thermoclostridium stercorarium]AGC68328.1 hypothetical protein Cst_c13370 [Thermoclostridium stercorarium subsp. stercorarium DSM 8532]AGI39352.1 hypothetical protein Clst_1291 [Thermoclostridium stercorarium subsp. stercorarium DSM 8532]ANW98673.1 hypothetical protein CSTERTH_06335 [Thermoclostridium stercorarium subsp. thermolacticum DSM 2910]UZQ86833.1 DUF2225 domain-containing protein [Thermoclostridium stercorarium]